MKKICCLLFTLIAFYSFAQQTFPVNYNQKPLKEVLTDIEEQTNLFFSYSEAAIKLKTITLVNNAITETQLLTALRNQTSLNFEKVSINQIIISIPSIDICAYLLGAENKTPLPFASILIKGTTKGTSSNDDGFFQLENIKQDAIVLIQYVGYSSKTINASQLKNETCLNIFLQPETQALQEVLLVADYITNGIDKNTNGSLTLRNNDLGILPGLVEPDVLQSLQLIPGISSLDESASGIQIRGGSPDQNLIYFDGIKMYHTGHFFGMISAINPYIVEKTKVYKSGASPEYGDRISGVIDISSDKNAPHKTTAGIGINGTHADAFIKTPLGKGVGLVASARRSYTDALQTPTFDALSKKVFQNTKIINTNTGLINDDEGDFSENVGKEDFFFYDGSAKLIFQPSENDNIAVSGFFANNDLDFSVKDDEDLTSDRLIVKKQGVSFSWQGTKFNKWQHSLNGYYSSLDTDYDNKVTEDLLLEEENLRKNTVEDYGLNASLAYDISDNHTIKAGYQFSNADVFFQLFRDEADTNTIDPTDDDNVPLPGITRDFNVRKKATNQTHSVYAEYLHKASNKGFISLGIRGSYYSLVDDFYIEPRINAEYPVSKVFRLKATAEKRYQSISQLVEFEDVQLRLEDHIWTLSDNLETPILESTQFSGGILIDANGWALDIDGYFKKINGLTSFTNGFTNAAEEFSEGKSDILGLDVLLRKKIKNFHVWLGYTFNDVDYTFPELQSTTFRGNNDITHNFRISNTFEIKNWELSLGWMYRTGSPFTPANSFNSTTGDINFGPINSLRLPNYHRLDTSVLYNFVSSKKNNFRGTVGVSLQNIYSRQVPVSVSYRVDQNAVTGQDELNRIQQLSLGLTPNMTVRLYF